MTSTDAYRFWPPALNFGQLQLIPSILRAHGVPSVCPVAIHYLSLPPVKFPTQNGLGPGVRVRPMFVGSGDNSQRLEASASVPCAASVRVGGRRAWAGRCLARRAMEKEKRIGREKEEKKV
jgi:hypothetical protein